MDDNLVNLTPFDAVMLPTERDDGRQGCLVLLSATFDLPSPSRHLAERLTAAEVQPPCVISDEWYGEPGASSLKTEGQSAYTRPGTDVYIRGEAWAPRGRPTRTHALRVRIGEIDHQVAAFGDRRWRRRITGLSLEHPQPFERLPLLWERSLGGPGGPDAPPRQLEALEQNPVGAGLYSSPAQGDGLPLPNLERPGDLLERWDAPPQPIGFGPVARAWMPRRAFAGTFDEAWMTERAPLWPKDFDERFFCAAAPGLWSSKRLIGGEACLLEGFHPDGPRAVRLPRQRLQAKREAAGGVTRQLMSLDGLDFDLEAATVTLIWRTVFWGQGGPLATRQVILRELQDWEAAPTE